MSKYKYLTSGLPVLLITVGLMLQACNFDHSKATNATAASVEDFDTFFNRFNTDTAFQVSRVSFPLKVVQKGGEGESDHTRMLLKKEWRPVKLVSLAKGQLIKKIRVGKDTVNVQLTVEDTGIQVGHFFVKQNGQWRLASVMDVSD